MQPGVGSHLVLAVEDGARAGSCLSGTSCDFFFFFFLIIRIPVSFVCSWSLGRKDRTLFLNHHQVVMSSWQGRG